MPVNIDNDQDRCRQLVRLWFAFPHTFSKLEFDFLWCQTIANISSGTKGKLVMGHVSFVTFLK